MNAKTLWDAKRGKTIQERKPAGRNQIIQRALMTTGASVGAALLIVATVAPICAQTYPNKSIRFILPMSPGGGSDFLGRIISQKLSEGLGQPVVPENRPGAGGNIGSELVAKARPDGYTIGIGTSAITISPSLYKKLNYDPIRDFAPISLAAEVPTVMIVRPSLPVKNLKEFVGYAKANPGKLNFSSSGIGTTPHLAVELLNSLAKINIVHVPYKGAGEGLTALLGGYIDMQVTTGPGAIPLVQAGKVRALAVLRNERLQSMPDVPTAKEAGIDNWEVTIWYGILAPAGTPRDIITRLNAEWVKSVAMPETRDKMKNAGLGPLSGTPEQYSELIKAEVIRWAKVIKDANIPRID